MPQLKVTGDRVLDLNPIGDDKGKGWEVTFDPSKMEIEVGWKGDKKDQEDSTAKRSKRSKKPNKLLFDDYVDKYDYLDNEEQSEKNSKRKNLFNNELSK